MKFTTIIASVAVLAIVGQAAQIEGPLKKAVKEKKEIAHKKAVDAKKSAAKKTAKKVPAKKVPAKKTASKKAAAKKPKTPSVKDKVAAYLKRKDAAKTKKNVRKAAFKKKRTEQK